MTHIEPTKEEFLLLAEFWTPLVHDVNLIKKAASATAYMIDNKLYTAQRPEDLIPSGDIQFFYSILVLLEMHYVHDSN